MTTTKTTEVCHGHALDATPGSVSHTCTDLCSTNACCLTPCTGCASPVGYLEVFPGGRCLECYRPEGERMARTMTAEKLARMWGGGR